ncbi:MAG: hypothetical protein WC874_00525, partial [Candidatus Izemoplasmatales bacterium]
ADFMERAAKESVTIKFSPSKTIASGKQETVIEFRGKNTPEEGVDEYVGSNVNLKITMRNLSQCVEIQEPAGGVLLEVAGFNDGQSGFIGTNYAPTVSAYAMTYQGFTDRGGVSSPYGLNNSYGNGLPFTNYGSQNLDAQQTDSFVIKNNCVGDVEIDLDPDSRVSVDEEKFTISANNDRTVTVSPGYTLGRYKVKVNAKAAKTEDSLQNIGTVNVTVQKLGDTDDDCIKVSTSRLNFNSFVQSPQTYKVYNYCYDLGTTLSRDPNAVSISCTPQYSPQMQGYQAPYLMYGQEQLYNNSYPLNTGGTGTDLVSYPGMLNNQVPYYNGWGGGTTNNYSSMYDYIRPNGTCIQNNCQMVSGTQIINRRMTQGGPNGSIEELIFQVSPSMNYIPQRQVYNQGAQTYGPIASILMLQNFAGSANTMTNLYGTINVEYSNRYGSGQCKNFPVQIEDNWNMLSLLDSAMLWGSSNAEPGDCVEPSALDIVSYWKKHGSSSGVVPDSSFKTTTYLHVADPPAIRVGGGASSVSIFNIGLNSSGGKCGLNDSLTNVKVGGGSTYGVTIKASTVSPSSKSTTMFGGGKGVNLTVEINRSGLKSNCAYIEVPVTATLKRAINMKSAEVSWTLKVLVAKEGYKVGSLEECENGSTAKTKEDCLKWLADEKASAPKEKTAKQILEAVKAAHKECTMLTESDVTAVQKGSCRTVTSDYGFKYINMTESLAEPVDCNNFFCNSTQAQAFLMKRYKEIDDAIIKLEDIEKVCKEEESSSMRDNRTLNNLYSEAEKVSIPICNGTTKTMKKFYTAEDDKGLVTLGYKMPSNTPAASKDKVLQWDKDSAIADMIDLLNTIITSESAGADKILLEVPSSDARTDTLGKIGTRVGDNYYIPIKNYLEILRAISKNESCKLGDGKDCTISVSCINATPIVLKNGDAQYLAENTFVKKGVPEVTSDTTEQNQIYKMNPSLGKIHALADFNMLLTKADFGEEQLSAFNTWANSNETITSDSAQNLVDFMEAKGLKFEGTSTSKDVGKYSTNLNYNYCQTGDAEEKLEMTVKFGDKSEIKDAKKASTNILLQKGYAFEPKSSSLAESDNGTIFGKGTADGKGIFYKRVPVKIEVTAPAGETSFEYEFISAPEDAPKEFLTWYNSSNAKFGKGKLGTDNKYLLGGIHVGSATTLKSIYYFPEENGNLKFWKGKSGDLSITATDVTEKNKFGTSSSIVESNGTPVIPTPQEIIDYANETTSQKVCISEEGDRVFWNEELIIK